LRGRIDLAQAQLTTGKEALAKLQRPALGTTIACMQGDADLARSQGDIDRAIVRISEAIDRAERAGRTRGNTYPKLLSFLAAVQHERGDLLASYDTQKKWQRLEEHSGRAGTVDYLNSRRAEAILLMALGEYIEAKSIIEAIVARWPSLSGNDSIPPRISQVRGVVMYTFGDLHGAERELAAAAARQRAQGGVQSALSMELELTRVLIDLGRTDEAERLLASIEAAGSQRTMRPFLTVPAVRAELLLARRALPQAAEVIDDEITALGFPTVKASVPLASALRVAARVQLESGNAERAQQRAADALAVSERLARDPAKSADVGEALLLLAQAQRLNGESATSIATAKRAARTLAGGFGDDHSLTRTARALAGS
jgi:tetratricopeptide (TPR) repeat protein